MGKWWCSDKSWLRCWGSNSWPSHHLVSLLLIKPKCFAASWVDTCHGSPWVSHFPDSPRHLLQNDVCFTVKGQELMNWRPLEVWKCNAFSSTFITKRVHFLRMLKCDLRHIKKNWWSSLPVPEKRARPDFIFIFKKNFFFAFLTHFNAIWKIYFWEYFWSVYLNQSRLGV
jgi:hypothetical protein